MKTLRILWVIVLVVVAGRGFNASAQTETNLHSFVGSPTDGADPFAGLVQGSDGNFYGTTEQGGANGVGTVFRISPGGSYSNLYSFGSSPTDGRYPSAGLVQGSDGNFYGTCQSGGANGGGTIFRISPSGSETNLYSFGSSAHDGNNPYAGLVQGSDGNFYGTTSEGGTSTNCPGYGCGTVFRISPSGTYTSLYSFSGGSNGSGVVAGLVQGSDGNFYGTTAFGGTSTNCSGYGCGTVFRISPSGTYTSLYSFVGYPNDGAAPEAGLVQGRDGNFYGTTVDNGGTVFRISPSGSETNLHSFVGSPNDGAAPEAGLVQGRDGNFYGTTSFGGTYSDGTVFRISPSGSETNLYSFGISPTDGEGPEAGLVQGSDGNFYGTTLAGGSTNLNSFCCYYGYGTVFKLTVSQSPPTLTIECPTTLTVTTDPGQCSASRVNLGLLSTSDTCTGTLTVANDAPATLPVGTNEVVWTVTDACGGGATCTQGVIVVDNQPPTISDVAVAPNVLWPPNHKMVLVTVDYSDSDNCGVAGCVLSATCNEPDSGLGNGSTANDIQLISGDPNHLYLRAEHSGSGNGRIYTITITCADTSGNTTTQSAQVTVPHDLGGK